MRIADEEKKKARAQARKQEELKKKRDALIKKREDEEAEIKKLEEQILANRPGLLKVFYKDLSTGIVTMCGAESMEEKCFTSSDFADLKKTIVDKITDWKIGTELPQLLDAGKKKLADLESQIAKSKEENNDSAVVDLNEQLVAEQKKVTDLEERFAKFVAGYDDSATAELKKQLEVEQKKVTDLEAQVAKLSEHKDGTAAADLKKQLDEEMKKSAVLAQQLGKFKKDFAGIDPVKADCAIKFLQSLAKDAGHFTAYQQSKTIDDYCAVVRHIWEWIRVGSNKNVPVNNTNTGGNNNGK